MWQLVAKGIYDEKQAKQMLLECANLVPSISQAEAYAKTVSDSFKAIKLREIGTQLAFDGVFAENMNDVADEVMSELYEVVSEQHKKSLKTVGDIGTQVFEAYSNNGQDLENRSYTGFLRLDEILRYVSWKFDNSSGKTQAWENRICSINCRERGEIWQNGRFLFAGDGKLRNL